MAGAQIAALVGDTVIPAGISPAVTACTVSTQIGVAQLAFPGTAFRYCTITAGLDDAPETVTSRAAGISGHVTNITNATLP